ncbi:leucine-rich repeat-containing protein [Tanacetum coccineum]
MSHDLVKQAEGEFEARLSKKDQVKSVHYSIATNIQSRGDEDDSDTEEEVKEEEAIDSKDDVQCSLFNLPHLQTLNLASNNFTGSQIPSEIGRFSNSLTHLNLSDCRFSGQVPMDITLLHKLVSLDLNDDLKLEPHVFINMQYPFKNITSMDLSFNKLNGILPSWLFTSPYLEYLVLYGNMFSGNVPFESFALPSLTLLDLTHNNQLSGQIDMQTFRQLTNLTHLDLSFNNFSGEWELDTLLSSLKNLEYLDLSYNGFSVTTNNANHYVNPGFLFLKLASCKLKVFPESFRAMKQLQELDLSDNEIHGHIPHWAGEIGRNELWPYADAPLAHLNSRLCQGTIPNVFEGFVQLEGLNLNGNRLEGGVPSSLSKCESLRVLILKSNNFHGNIQPSFAVKSPFPGLQVLDLSHNSFVGNIPQSLVGIKGLEVLDLSQNHLVGRIPGGTQFNTFDENSFAGNLGLCGFPLPKK